MSYRGGSSYRGPADRSRSPPRFGDCRGSTTNVFDPRHTGPNAMRNGSDAPRGPRSQFDGPPRGPPSIGQGPGSIARPSLRDAPPLGSGARPFRERDYPDRRERSPPPRERSPPRKFTDQREFPPRDLDIRSARRGSRDGPLSAGSNYSDNIPFSSSSYRGGSGFRGRGRGDFEFRGGARGGRRALDERGGDLFPARRERSPPPRFGRDLSRDGREPERRDDRRFERREDERRPEWTDRERERERERGEVDRSRREPPPARLESRMPSDIVPSANAMYSAAAAPPINPERLAIIESSGVDTGLRRPPASISMPAPTQRREPPPPETPAYLNGRADAAAQRYGSRGSSPPTQAPPVPAFSFSVAPMSTGTQAAQAPKPAAEVRSAVGQDFTHEPEASQSVADDRSAPPPNAPTAPKAAPVAPRAHHASPPPMAPRAPRALEIDAVIPPSNRLHGVKSLENMLVQTRSDPHQTQPPSSMPPSPGATRHPMPHLAQPIFPNPPQAPRLDISVPTGPKAVRAPVSQTSMSPRAPFTSPRSDAGVFQPTTGPPRTGTPPPTAPSGSRRQSFSVSPKVTASSIPTAPKAARGGPAMVPRVGQGPGPMPAMNRPSERPPFAPSGPRSQLQWNQWRRLPLAGPSTYGDKLISAIPAKRDANGDEKDRQEHSNTDSQFSTTTGHEYRDEQAKSTRDVESATKQEDRMDIDHEPTTRKSPLAHSQATTRASFFGGTLPRSEQNIIDSSDEEDDELDEDEDATLLEAKHARRERELRAKLHDLSAAHFRATSPLESIARLARLCTRDLERSSEHQRQDLMDIDAGTGTARGDMPSATHSSGSEEGPEVTTPRVPQEIDVAIREGQAEETTARAPRRRSPEPVSLPYLLKGDEVVPLQESDVFQDNIQEIEDEDPEVEAALEEVFQAERGVKHDAEVDFADAYMRWREECGELERIKVEQEKLERQMSTEPGPVLEAPLMPLMNPILEGRRLHKNSSEYEIERVIRESEETARIEQEKLDREAKKVQADMEKEAKLPDQETEEAFALDTLVNTNRLRDPAKLLRVFSYEPPPDTFTENEQDIFIAAFKESPKKWGEIASLLVGRTYKDCIHHYYANKWDGRFRDNRTKKFKGGRRGRGGKAARPSRGSAAMADMNRGEDLTVANDTSTGRPKRAAAPTTFGEKEVEAKSLLVGPSPAKKPGPGPKLDANGEDKPAKKARRAAGEGKPGRKGKTQLATLAAAAPGMSPHKQPPPQPKEEIVRMGGPSLEDANLLAHLQGGHRPIMQHDGHIVFSQESMQSHMMIDESEAGRPLMQASKQSASSYWSVPEQTDFAKYIAHFGTDFGAIASHMGTKTLTMIKNHYQRQVDGGRSDLAEQAADADQRRDRGEDMGPPPTPTPIIKRKYDNPQGSTPRALAPQADAMDVDEPASLSRPPTMQQASPPQLQTKPRYTGSAQGTPIQSQRVVPAPMPPVSTPATPMPSGMPMSRGGYQHPLGGRYGLLAENRPEARPNMQPSSMFRPGQDPIPTPSRSQPPPAHLTRTLSTVPHPEFLRDMEQNLQAERSRALQLQAQNEHEARMEHTQPRQHPGIPHTHGSPLSMQLPANASTMPPQERRREYEDRVGTPSRGGFPSNLSARPNLVNPNPSVGSGPQFGVSGLSALGRTSCNPSPSKLDSARPSSVSASAPTQQLPMAPHTPAPSPAPNPAPNPASEPPKKSNLMSILNSEPEETKPAIKRDSQPSAATTRVASPAPPFSSAQTPQPMSNMPTSRRDTFGQPTAPHSQFHRGPFGQSMSTPGPTPATLKQEPSNAGTSAMQQAPKHEWHPRMSQGSQPSPPAPAPLDRDPRDARSSYPYAPHRAMFSGLNPPGRANPSPPPSMLGHSRTPSLTQAGQSQREPQRSVLGAGPPTTPASLHANPYARQEQQAPFSQPPPQATNRAHHSHNNSLTQGASILERYGNPGFMSRDEALQREEDARAYQQHYHHQQHQQHHQQHQQHHQQHQQHQQQQQRLADQERASAIQREREREAYQRQAEAEHEMRQREAYSQRGPPIHHQPLQTFGGGPFGGGRQSLGGMSMREMSARDAEAAMQDQRHREQLDHERRRAGEQPPLFGRERDAMPVDRYGQRPPPPEERQPPLFKRQTPQSGTFSFPPPPPNRR